MTKAKTKKPSQRKEAHGRITEDLPVGTRFTLQHPTGRKRTWTFAGFAGAPAGQVPADPTVFITDERGLPIVSPGTAKNFTLTEWNATFASRVTARIRPTDAAGDSPRNTEPDHQEPDHDDTKDTRHADPPA